MKLNYIETLEAGDQLENEVFFLRTFEEKIGSDGESIYIARFEDKTGVIYGTMLQLNYNEALNKLVGTPVYVSGLILWRNSSLQLSISRMQQCNEIDISELCNGLTDSEIDEKVEHIKEVIKKFNEGTPARNLLDKVFTAEMFSMMAERPATLMQGSRYRGGLLSAADCALRLVMSTAQDYWDSRNRFYTTNTSGALAVCGVLLYYAAKTRMYTAYPFKRTEESILGGTQAIVGSLLTEVESTLEDALPEDFKKKILHIVISADDLKIKPVCKEAVFVKAAIALFNECDQLDNEKFELQSEGKSGVVYSKRTGRYLYV